MVVGVEVMDVCIIVVFVRYEKLNGFDLIIGVYCSGWLGVGIVINVDEVIIWSF